MKITKRIMALLLILAMILTFGACTEKSNVSDIEVNSSETMSVDDSSLSSEDAQSKDQTSSEPQSPSKNESNLNNDTAIDMASLRGKTVNVLMWREFTAEEVTRIAKFEKETGIKVDKEVVASNAYTAKLASKVSANESPDLAMIQTDANVQGAFPLGVASLFQPISVTKQDLSDKDIWDIGSMDQLKLKGKYYAFIANNAWYNCGSIIMYNDDILTKCGTEKPYELWKAGKWNWDSMKSIAQKVYDYGKKSGNNYSGIGQQTANSVTMGNYMLKSAGVDYVSYDGKKFSNTITDSNVLKTWTFHAQMMESKAYDNTATANSFFNQKLALYSTNLWAMKIDGGQIDLCKFKVMAVPFPSPSGQDAILPGNPNAFGIPKGANDPVAAGVFLKYFVDPANGEDYAKLTGNEASREVYNYLSNPNTKKSVSYASGALGYTNLANLEKLNKALAGASSSQVTTVLQQYRSFVNNAVEKINKVIN